MLGQRLLITSIERYIEQYNQHGRPFVWSAIADSIRQKVARLCNVISGTEHWEVFTLIVFDRIPSVMEITEAKNPRTEHCDLALEKRIRY